MKLFVLSIGLLIPSIAFSAPSITSISGNIDNRQQITINGDGFGSNGPNVILFDDFSTGSVGSAHPSKAIVGNWASAKCITYADPALSNGRGAQCVGSGGKLTNTVTFPTTQEVFVSSTAYVPPGYIFPYASSPRTFPDRSAMKHFWLLYGSSGYSDSTAPDMVSPTWTSKKFYRVASNDGDGLSTFDTGGGTAWAWDEPVRWTLWAKGNGTTVAGSNGMFQGVSATGGHQSYSYKDYKAWFNSNHAIFGWDRVNIPGYLRSEIDVNLGHRWVIDDMYVAAGPNAAARVEIGNATTYAASTNLALFTPDSWTNNSITATVRKGRFANGSKVYLYVSDANGIVNSTGFPITLGTDSTGSGTDDPTAAQMPSAPKNLRIQ